MAIIKNLAFCSRDILKRLSFVNFDQISSSFTPFPFDVFHYLLPFKFKFLSETYVVMDEGRVFGLITVEKDDSNKKRLKITRFFLEENSINYGELLINYVVNRFLAQGAESFYVTVSEDDGKLIKLLTDVCNFRVACDEYYFKVKKSDLSYQKENSFSFIRFSKNSEIKQITELYNSMVSSFLLPVFRKPESHFKDNIFVGVTNKVSFKYVLENEDKKHIFGYFVISTGNNKDFVLDVTLSLGFEVYLTDILMYACSEISKRKTAWTLYVRINTCFSNHKELLNIMKGYQENPAKKSKVLVKDMCRPVPADNGVKRIIFNDVTPAY